MLRGARAAGKGLYGLRSVGDSAEVRGLVPALPPKVWGGREPLDAQAVGNALYGLQSLGHPAEVRGLVAVLAPQVAEAGGPRNARHAGDTLYLSPTTL